MSAPSLRVIAGGVPTDEELAALVTVLSLVQARNDAHESSAKPSRWRTGARTATSHGRDSWLGAARRSALR